MQQLTYSISPLGDSAIVVKFGCTIEEYISLQVLTAFEILSKAALPGVIDLVPAYASLVLHYNPVKLMNQKKPVFDYVVESVIQLLDAADDLITNTSRHLSFPVCYALRFGSDLEAMSQQIRLTVEDIIQIHTSRSYRVYMIGFLPGFAYMGEVDNRISIPRHAQPRMNIEAGSVGIADIQTGIYPLASPGGWQIIGRTPVKTFDSSLVNPVYFHPGDQVTFYSITEDEFENY